jgi:hypothetical protein
MARPTQQFTEADGHQLAADMLREVHDEWLTDPWQADDGIAGWRKAAPVVLPRYLMKVREASSPELERGFFAVLTDFIGGSLDGVVPEAQFYERESEAPRTQ